MKDREHWVDIAKGLGIIAVVIGHTDNSFNSYLYWFHMPLFFIISGYLHRAPSSMSEYKEKVKKKSIQFILPYFSYGIIIAAIFSTLTLSPVSFIRDIIRLIYGGELLTGYFGVFWFITVLLLTQVSFNVIQLKCNKNTQLLIITLCYICAQLISHVELLKNIIVPWNSDAVLIAIVYYAIGFYGKSIIKTISKKFLTFATTCLIAITFIILQEGNYLKYSLDMKNNLYNHPLLDLIIPFTFTLLVFSLSYHLSLTKKVNVLAYLGKISLSIMYLHMPIKYFLITAFNFQIGWIELTIIGVAIPCLIHTYILTKYPFYQRFFLGIQNNS